MTLKNRQFLPLEYRWRYCVGSQQGLGGPQWGGMWRAFRTSEALLTTRAVCVCIWRLVCELKKRVGLPVSVASPSSADLLALPRHLTSSASQLRLCCSVPLNMGKKCFVRNCNSGYLTCAERVSLFKAPHELERLEKWRRVIPRADRVLQPTDHVCAKHFQDEVISTAYHTEYKGNVLLHAPKKPVLSPEAVPSIFPNCPKYLTVPQKSREPPRKRQALVPTSRNQGQPVVPSTSEELRQNGENAPGLQTSSEDADTESTGALRKGHALISTASSQVPMTKRMRFNAKRTHALLMQLQHVSASIEKNVNSEQESSLGPMEEQRSTECPFLHAEEQEMTVSALLSCASTLHLPRYRFLMESEILALPSIRTIQRYISLVGFKTGFDSKFFTALKSQIQKKDDFRRHGVIIFDEMQVRKSKRVNSKTMTYVGLASETANSGEVADHALVFMFCPLVKVMLNQ
ncbi:hypothetical protein HPB50_009642 [Hyalomma asiaticum]|uniref:Uncharacterized protein n=1 Tax=Hyalomma asiaticum TaxID=266040 RepID=A0ACB7SFX1_HYAAI|nr:hypothetical protein HPB50_009642 [Hyalomma asiaticum]